LTRSGRILPDRPDMIRTMLNRGYVVFLIRAAMTVIRQQRAGFNLAMRSRAILFAFTVLLLSVGCTREGSYSEKLPDGALWTDEEAIEISKRVIAETGKDPKIVLSFTGQRGDVPPADDRLTVSETKSRRHRLL
jgi:hypothetical protein